MIFLWIFVSLVMFSIIVLLHEYGHYKTARLFKIQVDEFGLWIPPRAKKLWKNKEGTLFSLNWIPLGGFVKIAGESPEHPQAPTWYNFFEKNIWQKTAVLIAGVVMNFILAFLIFFIVFLVWVKPVGVNTVIPTELESKIIPTFEQAIESGLILKNPGILLYPVADGIAEKAGIQQADMLLSVNGKAVTDIDELQEQISQNPSISLEFTLKKVCHDTQNCVFPEERTIQITPSSEGKIGSYLSPNYSINEDFKHQYWVWNALKYAGIETYVQSRLTLSWLAMLLQKVVAPETPKEREEAIDQMAGPIWIVSVVTQSLAGWLSLLLILSALISINLWVFNLLPIPALDGGRILLLWVRSFLELLLGKNKIIVVIENHLHLFFFLLLIALSVLIAYNDITKLF